MSACGAPDVPATSIAAEGGRASRPLIEGALAGALGQRLERDLQPVELDALLASLD